jgi:hypothetical protein
MAAGAEGDGERRSVALEEARAGVKLRAGERVVLVVNGARWSPALRRFEGPSETVSDGVSLAALTILAADGTAGHGAGKLRLGAGNALQLKWSVTGAAKAALSAKSLIEKACAASEKPSTATQVSNDQVVSFGLELPLDAQGSGSGLVRIDPGPCGSTEYAISLTPRDGSSAPLVKATAFVANFNVQLELPDGSDYARNKPCVLEIPGQSPVQGTTNECGELWLWLPNLAAEDATLRLMDGGRELASWKVALGAEEGVPDGALALNDAPAESGGGDRVA